MLALPIKFRILFGGPSVWLTTDKRQCWWPNSLNARPYMVKSEKPNEQWKLYDIEVEGYSSTLEGARKKAENPEYTSTQEDVTLAGRGHRKITKKQVSTDESSDECSPPPSPGCIPPSTRSTLRNNEADNLRGTTVCSSASEPLPTLSENSNETNFNYGAAVDDYVNSTEYIAVQEHTAVGAPLAIETVNINELPVHIEGNITVQDLHNSIDQLKYICLENQKCINDIYKILRNMSLKEGEINVSQKEKFCKWLPLVDLDKLKQLEDELN
ncbi:hypothetical protein PPYR_07686 [Photinus pyralis]|uniref:Uncharacterized protein n=1 Tax=Photinus pyralis TaxID=7054 RepID=A0A5N4AR80_PHOPY|nr:uncharacterized protein LOC116167552 [Photinus pyralis]KAB0799806.1 hypothetical protein PPYR_07686 [Photinus pyralis]